MNLTEFEALFRRFELSAFRLEARDTYDVAFEREEFNAFLAGKPAPAQQPQTAAWLHTVAAASASGKFIERVRIISRPLNDYTRFELSAYPENIAAGERIRVLERRSLNGSDVQWAGRDFWIFDEETVVLLHYDNHSRFLGVEQATHIQQYLRAKERALSLAVDLERVVS